MRATVPQQIDQQKLQVLAGERGDPLDHALRRRQLEEVQTLIGQLKKQASDITARLAAAQSDILSLGSAISDAQAALDGLADAIADVEAILAGLAGVQDELDGLKTDIAAVSVPALTAANAAGATPTDIEFNAVVADLAVLRTAILDLVGTGT